MRFPENSENALVDSKEFIQLQKLAENGWIENPPLKKTEYEQKSVKTTCAGLYPYISPLDLQTVSLPIKLSY